MPKTLNNNAEVNSTGSCFTVRLKNISCVGKETIIWATTSAYNHKALNTTSIDCCKTTNSINLTICNLEPESKYNISIFASANCSGVTRSDNFTFEGSTKPKSESCHVLKKILSFCPFIYSVFSFSAPNIAAQIRNITSNSVNVTWLINEGDCVQSTVNFSFIARYSGGDSDIIASQNTVLAKNECQTTSFVTLEFQISPFRDFEVSAYTCNKNGDCGHSVQLNGQSLPAGKVKFFCY